MVKDLDYAHTRAPCALEHLNQSSKWLLLVVNASSYSCLLAEIILFLSSVSLPDVVAPAVACLNVRLCRIRDLNDEINKLIREKGHWERRIVELGGPDYSKSAPKVADSRGREVAEMTAFGLQGVHASPANCAQQAGALLVSNILLGSSSQNKA
eukprot:scaffold76870_cov20-Tisochrysis_lutea.AAC.3